MHVFAGMRTLFGLLFVGLFAGCTTAAETATRIVYARDPRTNICFASIQGNPFHVTYVPCELIPLGFLEGLR